MSEEARTRPMVAVGVIVRNKDGKILLGERLASHGNGTYQIPGGHMEFGATFEETARSEVAEETGLTDITLVKLVSISNERVYGKHYVNVCFLVDHMSGEPENPEPDKSRNWQWYDINNLPDPIFLPSKNAIDSWLSGELIQEISDIST